MKRFISKRIVQACLLLVLVAASGKIVMWWRFTHPNLQYIIRHGTLSQLKQALKHARNLNDEDSVFCLEDHSGEDLFTYDLSPLCTAAQYGKYEMAMELLKAGANPRLNDNGMQSPMAKAVLGGNEKLLINLIRLGADPDVKANIWNEKAVTIAAVAHNRELFDLILKRIPNLVHEGTGVLNDTPLHYAVQSTKTDLAFPAYLLKLGSDVSARDRWGIEPVHYAAECSAPKMVEYLVKHGANPYSCTNDGETILHYAVGGNSLECTKYISTKYPKLICQADNQGETPLSRAQENSRGELITYLRSVGGDQEPNRQVAKRERIHAEHKEMFDRAMRGLARARAVL